MSEAITITLIVSYVVVLLFLAWMLRDLLMKGD